MEPGTDGAPLILKSELSPPMNSEDGGTISVYRCIANLKGKVCRDADPRGKYADTPIRARRMARCIGVSVRAGRVAGYVGVSVYRRCEGKSTPTRPFTRQIRRYADTPIRAVNTPLRRYADYADPGREGISVYRCIGAELFTRRGLRALCNYWAYLPACGKGSSHPPSNIPFGFRVGLP